MPQCQYDGRHKNSQILGHALPFSVTRTSRDHQDPVQCKPLRGYCYTTPPATHQISYILDVRIQKSPAIYRYLFHLFYYFAYH